MPPSGHAQHPYGGGGPGGAAQGYPPQQLQDTTGQVAPPGMKPRVTATLWEDEGSMCFQVEAKGVCVARRDGTFGETTAMTMHIDDGLLTKP